MIGYYNEKYHLLELIIVTLISVILILGFFSLNKSIKNDQEDILIEKAQNLNLSYNQSQIITHFNNQNSILNYCNLIEKNNCKTFISTFGDYDIEINFNSNILNYTINKSEKPDNSFWYYLSLFLIIAYICYLILLVIRIKDEELPEEMTNSHRKREIKKKKKELDNLYKSVTEETKFAEKRKKEKELKNIFKKLENDKVEFKSSFRYCLEEKQIKKILEFECAKAIAGFLNYNGGELFIGVNDDGTIFGLEKEYALLKKKKNSDGFILMLNQRFDEFLGKKIVSHYIRMNVETVDNKEIVRVIIKQSDEPVFIRKNNEDAFFVRVSSQTNRLKDKELIEYIQKHFKSK